MLKLFELLVLHPLENESPLLLEIALPLFFPELELERPLLLCFALLAFHSLLEVTLSFSFLFIHLMD